MIDLCFLLSGKSSSCPVKKSSVADGSSLHNPCLPLLRNQGRGHGPLPWLCRPAGIGFEPASCTFGYCSEHRWSLNCQLRNPPRYQVHSAVGYLLWALFSPTIIRIEPKQDSIPRPEDCWPGFYQPEPTDLTDGVLFFHISLLRTPTLKI